MTPADALVARLRFLCRVVRKEARHLSQTDERLFSQLQSTPEALLSIEIEPLLAERLDAFVGRFGRLQDTLADKLLPTLLLALGESRGPAIDNLDRAEKFNWIHSADDWMQARQLRNLMVHEYIEDRDVLRDAIYTGHAFVPSLVAASERLVEVAIAYIDRPGKSLSTA